MSDLTHFGADGRARMVDVGEKDSTARVATARGVIRMQAETLDRVRSGGIAKGDVLGVAQVAAIMAAKRTAELIPMCHPLFLDGVDVAFELGEATVEIAVTVKTHAKTGVEMEALTAVSVGLLTIYDMCKAIDRGMEIDDVRLDFKAGGKSGTWRRAGA